MPITAYKLRLSIWRVTTPNNPLTINIYVILCSHLSFIALAAGFLLCTDYSLYRVYAKKRAYKSISIYHVYHNCERTPGVVSVDELRWFWISWQDDVFQFGSGYRPRLNIIHSLRYIENRVPPINIMVIASIYNNTQSFWSIPEVYYISGKCIIHRARSWPGGEGGPGVRILPHPGQRRPVRFAQIRRQMRWRGLRECPVEVIFVIWHTLHALCVRVSLYMYFNPAVIDGCIALASSQHSSL